MQVREGLWTFRDPAIATPGAADTVVGYDVEAQDGSIGKVDEATFDVGSSYVIVDTGPWIFGKKVMLPAGIIRSVDHDTETVFVARTKDEIKSAPEFDDSLLADDEYRGRLANYYGPGGVGYRDPDAI